MFICWTRNLRSIPSSALASPWFPCHRCQSVDCTGPCRSSTSWRWRAASEFGQAAPSGWARRNQSVFVLWAHSTRKSCKVQLKQMGFGCAWYDPSWDEFLSQLWPVLLTLHYFEWLTTTLFWTCWSLIYICLSAPLDLCLIYEQKWLQSQGVQPSKNARRGSNLFSFSEVRIAETHFCLDSIIEGFKRT